MPVHSLPIESIQYLTADTCRLTLKSGEIARTALPGQFLHVRPRSGHAPLLRRPFSIHDIDVEHELVELLFQVVGSGTRILSERQEGETVDVLGPLGRGFTVAEDISSALIIAGGIGIAPFPLLIRNLVEKTDMITVLAGWRTASDVIVTELLEELGATIDVATEDGSRGFKGLVTDLLIDVLEKSGLERDASTLFSCGPTPMLARVSEIASAHNLCCQVSLEEMMACGIGACAGCAVPRHSGPEGDGTYALVCRDGPVFDSQEVVLT